MTAIIGAVGRLIDAGMDGDDATDTVLWIMRESEPGRAPMTTPLDKPVIDRTAGAGSGLHAAQSIRTTARYALKFL